MKFILSNGGPGTVNVWAWPKGRKRFMGSAIVSGLGGWATPLIYGNGWSRRDTLRKTIRTILASIR